MNDIDVFVIYSDEDRLMNPRFARQFFEARYGQCPRDNERPQNYESIPEYRRTKDKWLEKKSHQVVCLHGGHGTNFTSDVLAMTTYLKYLRKRNLVENELYNIRMEELMF